MTFVPSRPEKATPSRPLRWLTMPESTNWEQQPDGARSRKINGIRVTVSSSPRSRHAIAHLMAHRESGGALVVTGLDDACRAVYQTVL